MRYLEIATQLKEMIDAGGYQPGERLPSVRSLSDSVKASTTTVARAYEILESWGYSEPRPQSGHFVSYQLPNKNADRKQLDSGQPATVSISDILTEIEDTHEQFPNVVQLAISEPVGDMIPKAPLQQASIRTVKNYPEYLSQRASISGLPALRTQIARNAMVGGCVVSPDEIVITSSAQESLILSLLAVTTRGDILALESPSYAGILQAAEALGLRTIEIPTEGNRGISLEALTLALEQWPVKACFAMPTLSSPQGTSMPTDKRRQLVELLNQRGIPLIEGDDYSELVFSGERPKLTKAYDQTGQVIVCSSVSRTVSPGFRTGWIIGGRYTRKIRELKYHHGTSPSLIEQQTIADFLGSGHYPKHLRRMRRVYAQQTRAVRDRVLEYFPAGTRAPLPEGGFVLWIALPENVDSKTLYHRAMERGVCIAPGILFTSQKRLSNFIRLSCVYPIDNKLDNAIRILGECVAELKQARH